MFTEQQKKKRDKSLRIISGNVQSVNWHFISRCNYHCRFCCTRNLCGECTSLDHAEKILSHIIRLGIKKINFVGGEPFCSPIILEIVRLAKTMNLITSTTTNGSLLTEEKLTGLIPYLDWIGISLDSHDDKTEISLGRGNGEHISHIRRIVPLIHKTRIRLKINTTVTKKNYREDMRFLIKELNPDRWKVFQVIHVPGQNDNGIEDLRISLRQFKEFQKKHEEIRLSRGDVPVFESVDEMIDSYLTISPDGCLFSNTQYPSRSIPLDQVTPKTLTEFINITHYFQRGAVYDW